MDASLLTSFQPGNIHVCVICCKVCYFAAQAYKITDLTSKKGTEWNMHCAPADWFCTGRNLFAECIWLEGPEKVTTRIENGCLFYDYVMRDIYLLNVYEATREWWLVKNHQDWSCGTTM